MSKVIQVSDATFEQEVLKSDKPVVIDFYADWCGPCKAFAPTLEKFAAAHPELKVVKINTEENPLSSNGIRSIPTLALVKDGKAGIIGTGNMPMPELEGRVAAGIEFFDKQPTSPTEPKNTPPKGPTR